MSIFLESFILKPYYAFCNYDDEFVTYYHFLTLYHKASLLYWYLSQEQQQPAWTLAGFVWKNIFFKSMRQETKKYLDCWWIRVETKKDKYSGRIENTGRKLLDWSLIVKCALWHHNRIRKLLKSTLSFMVFSCSTSCVTSTQLYLAIMIVKHFTVMFLCQYFNLSAVKVTQNRNALEVQNTKLNTF